MKTKNILLVLFTLFHIVSFTAILPQMPEGEFLIDPNPVYIPTGGNQDKSGIAFDGTNFLVVWEDYRTYPPDIYAARVTQDGLVLDMGGIPVCTFAEVQSQPSVEFDGTNYLVVWADYRDGNYDIYGAR